MLAENKALRDKLEKLENGHTEFFRVDIGDGVVARRLVHAAARIRSRRRSTRCWCTSTASRPARPCSTAGAARNHLWHRMLAQNGYIVMSFDNRGTPAPRGRAWRKSVFHQIGILAPKDQAAAVQGGLAQRPYIDKDRVGVWGWSGGGSMSLNAIFKYPRPLQDGHRRRPGRQSAVLRHDLPGALHGPAGRQRRGLSPGLADQLRPPAQGQPALDPRHRRRQLPLPGDRGPDQRADPPQQAVHDDGLSQPLPRASTRGRTRRCIFAS